MKANVNAPITRPKSIWNGVNHADQQNACQWQPHTQARLRRDTSSGACTPSTETKHHCYDEKNFKGHGDIHKTNQEEFAIDFCLSVVKAGDVVYNPSQRPSKKQGYIQSYFHDDTRYTYRLRWEDGCDEGVSMQNASYPLGRSSQDCSQIMFDNYLKCESDRDTQN